MKLIKLNTLFDIIYGNSFDLNMLDVANSVDENSVNYVSRTRENNGVSAVVCKVQDVEPFSPGLITVAGSGNSVLESFIQPFPFYTGYHVFVLKSKIKMTDEEKLFYCYCIRANQYKYNFGRQANKTLKEILVPDEIPQRFKKNIKDLNNINRESVINKKIRLDIENWNYFSLSEIFTFKRGKEIINKCEDGNIPLISSSEKNNGIGMYINNGFLIDGNVITLAINGSIGEAFYQPHPFCATTDIIALCPKFTLNKYIGLFTCAVLRKEKYRFNYGRKWGYERLINFKIKLPTQNYKPDFEFMENYIKSLPYSKSL